MTGPLAPPAARSELAERLHEAVHLLRQERLEEAAPVLESILARWPEQGDALHFLGILRHMQGRSDEGLALIRRAVAAMPAEPGPWNNLGNVLLESQKLDEALEAYRTSIAVSKGTPASAEALNNLGTVLRKRNEHEEAERAYRDALAVRPEFVDAWYNLSHVLMHQGRIVEGLLANSKGVTLSPRHLIARDQVIRALLLQGEREQAAALYREWLAEEPDNPVVQHQLAACLGDAPPPRASDAYIERVFDGFSRSFDVKLEQLHYRAPQLVTDALRGAVGEPQGTLDVCDAGCGTGLCGPLVRPWARRLVGCDLSVGMLKQAKPRNVYDALHKAELVHYLTTQPGAFDVVLSADTLCYFGDLSGVMAAAHVALRPGGSLLYTVEALGDETPEPHVLQANGRYAHARRHLEEVARAAGLAWQGAQAVVLRTEAGRPVNGWLVTVRRRDDSAAPAT